MNARALLQWPVWAAFAAFIGYFSSAPAWHPLPPGTALVKLSFSHAGGRRQPCRERTAEELARLAPNMRAAQDCPRERSDVRVELEMDGRVVHAATASPSGLRHDLPSTVYHRLEVPAGRHAFRARLSDTADGAFSHVSESTVDLAPGAVLVIDFAASRGGFLFQGGG